MKTTRMRILFILLISCFALIPFRHQIRALLYKDTYTVEDRLQQYEDQAKQRLLPFFDKAKVTYPPDWMGIVALKDGEKLEVWVASDGGPRVLLRSYPILAASGVSGPKLQEGDFQVPEGVYQVESLHPNSLYHLALRVNYPNNFDRSKAKQENRSNLGGDIMIHGDQVSIGCLAMGDQAIEEIFILAARVWPARIPIIISPTDFRTSKPTQSDDSTLPWLPELYSDIQHGLGMLTE